MISKGSMKDWIESALIYENKKMKWIVKNWIIKVN